MAAIVRPLVILAAAGVVAGVFFLGGWSDEPLGEQLLGPAWLVAPYLTLAYTSVGSPGRAWGVILALLLAGSAFGLWASATSSTGGLAFLWIVPAQVLAAFALRLPRFRSPT